MPELPDVCVYVERLRAFTVSRALQGLRIVSPFVLRSVDPKPPELVGHSVVDVRRIGKRVVLSLEDDLYAVIHLMIAGRLRWRKPGAKLGGRMTLAAFDFDDGTLLFTEASKQRRASLHLVRGGAGLAAFDRGGLDVFKTTPAAFANALRSENHTVKRALTDPTLLDGIGNAYSDEILHRARMTPFAQTRTLSDEDFARLHGACASVLSEWTARLRTEVGDGFPEGVTAFRPEMAVHGKYGQPCPVCGSAVQRIVYANNEANYCATCQTGGRLLADRALSRLLKSDWPKTLEELEERRLPPATRGRPYPPVSTLGLPSVPGRSVTTATEPPRMRTAPRKARAPKGSP